MVDVADGATSEGGAELAAERLRRETWIKSYSYLRTAMVALLISLGAAVFYQTSQQRWHPLASVSAYYYTPAQAIFVGALIGLGACMIALKGTNLVEDVILNIGGMFAAVVAIVPTSRGKDFETAVRACRESATPLLTEKASKDLSCPTVLGLVEATRANVENNMVALLIVGLLGLLAAVYFARRDARGLGGWFWWGFGAACVVYAAVAVVFFAFTDWFVGWGHYLAAGGLLVCVIAVTIVNAFRRQSQRSNGTGAIGSAQDKALARTQQGLKAAGGTLARKPSDLEPYAWLAWVMIAVAVVGGVLVLVNPFALFWVEIAVALLFVIFWTAQTLELMPRSPAPVDHGVSAG